MKKFLLAGVLLVGVAGVASADDFSFSFGFGGGGHRHWRSRPSVRFCYDQPERVVYYSTPVYYPGYYPYGYAPAGTYGVYAAPGYYGHRCR